MGNFFVWLLAWGIVSSIWGAITKYISGTKGYDGGFAWGFWLGWIGLIVVAVRPTIKTQTTYKPMYPQAVSREENNGWECACGSKNPYSLDYCVSCRRSRSEGTAKSKVKCPHCGANNSEGKETCFACGKSMKEPAAASLFALQPTVAEIAAAPTVQEESFERVIEKLAQLREKGLLSEEEFQEKKAEVLAKL